MAIESDFEVIKTRAKKLAAADRKLRSELIKLRHEANLRQADVAAFLGVTPQAVQKMERHDSDPRLSTLRRYANAVGALVTHRVVKDRTSSLWKTSDSTYAQSEKRVVPLNKVVFKPSGRNYRSAESSGDVRILERV